MCFLHEPFIFRKDGIFKLNKEVNAFKKGKKQKLKIKNNLKRKTHEKFKFHDKDNSHKGCLNTKSKHPNANQGGN